MRVDGFHIFNTMREQKACEKRMVSRDQRKFSLSVGSRGGRTDRETGPTRRWVSKAKDTDGWVCGKKGEASGGARFLSSCT